MDQTIDPKTLENFNDFFDKTINDLKKELDRAYAIKGICNSLIQGIAEMSIGEKRYFDINKIISDLKIAELEPWQIIEEILYALDCIYWSEDRGDCQFLNDHKIVDEKLHHFVLVVKYH